MPFDATKPYFAALGVRSVEDLKKRNFLLEQYKKRKAALEKEKSVTRYKTLLRAYKVLSHKKTRDLYMSGKLGDSKRSVCTNVPSEARKKPKSNMMFNGTENTPRGLGVCEVYADKGEVHVGKDGFNYRVVLSKTKGGKTKKKWEKVMPKAVGEKISIMAPVAKKYVGARTPSGKLRWVRERPRRGVLSVSPADSPTKTFNYFPTPERQRILSEAKKNKKKADFPSPVRTKQAQITPLKSTPKTQKDTYLLSPTRTFQPQMTPLKSAAKTIDLRSPPMTPAPKARFKLEYVYKLVLFVSGLKYIGQKDQPWVDPEQMDMMIDDVLDKHEDLAESKQQELQAVLKRAVETGSFKETLEAEFSRIFGARLVDRVFRLEIHQDVKYPLHILVKLILDPMKIRYVEYFKPQLRSGALCYDSLSFINIRDERFKFSLKDQKGIVKNYALGITYDENQTCIAQVEDLSKTLSFSFD